MEKKKKIFAYKCVVLKIKINFGNSKKKKKNAKPVTKIKVIKIHRYTKIPKIKKSLVVKKKKIPHRPTEEQREIYLGIATPF